MKINFTLALFLSLFLYQGFAQSFTAGNIAALVAAASNSNTTASIVELNPNTVNQAPVTFRNINGTTGSNALRFSGSATSTGYLSNSNDGTLLSFTGANTTTTTGNINTQPLQGVGTYDAGGAYTLATTYTGGNGNQTRSASTLNNSNWFIGDQGGIYTNNSAGSSPSGNFRGIKSFGGVVYAGMASGTGGNIQVSTVSMPSGGTVAGLNGLPVNPDLQDFYLISSGSNGSSYDVLYVLSSTGTGTISKYCLVGGSWTARGTYTTGIGGFGLVAKKVGTGAELFVSSGTGATVTNTIVKFTDLAGYDININLTNNGVLYTAPTGSIIKGLAFAPAAPGAMRITEYMYDGAGNEFIEFTNVGGTAVDMNGWSYDDDSRAAGTVSLSTFGIVQPGESVILAQNSEPSFRTNWNLCNGVRIIGGLTTNLGRNDEINLYNAANTLIDRLTYGDENFPGTIRTTGKSGWVTAAGLGNNLAAEWTLAAVSDAEGSYAATSGDIGNPGKSTRAIVSYNACIAAVTGAPTIVMDVANTVNFLDGGATVAPASPYAVSGEINDATDPAKISGIHFTIGDDLTPVASLTVTVTSSNTAVVPAGGLVLTGTGASRNLKITPAAVGYSNISVTVNDGTNSTSYVLYYGASQISVTGTMRWPTGNSDASAAVAINDQYMIVADDEKNQLFVFDRGQSGLPVKTFDFNQGNLLGLTDLSGGTYREVDLEAAVASPTVAGKSYWLGSMSNSNSANLRPNRNRLFAVNVSGTGAATSFTNAGFYNNLRGQLLTWGDANGYNFTAAAADGQDPKLINGFNVEGMVFGPDNATLYIGFRAPLVPTGNRTKAVIAPVQNFETWFNNGAPAGNPTIGAPIELNLGGRGIRDMIRLTNGNYAIIAGSYDEMQVGALYSWTGVATDAPVLLTGYDITGINAEAILQVNENGGIVAKLQLLSDDGDNILYNDGVLAKELSQNNLKKFRSAVVAAPPILPLRFVQFAATQQGGNALLNWEIGGSDGVRVFEVYRSADGRNFTLAGTVTAVAGCNSYAFTDPNVSGDPLYYRIRTKEASGLTYWSAVRTIRSAGSQLQVQVYPNPVTGGQFSLYVNTTGRKNVQVYQENGALYQTWSFSNTTTDISTQLWPKGVYHLRVITENGTVVNKQVLVP